ncbi:polysulfide reductase NrfD [Vibrio sp. S17_S38]|uniref:NrfD/PsrC family molybdoenzyme membrane anchor subunit n=1 Tax=Vibrio sp. S17_S38 TaxID=2720229 RepID=UPI0016814845|nr:NrfD/PsrC family molybdoenzyme membrane anchor subunit [Vibrio sp. S17_S38]MBD1573154.1 polysulfide reductase NrfD [Vibrio sp. S17_S38]
MSITEVLVPMQDVAWLPWAVQYFFYIGSAYAAAILFLISLVLRDKTSHQLRASFALCLGICAIVGPLALTADLHQPGRAWHFFIHLTSWSWMSRGAVLLPLFSMLSVAAAWLYLRPDIAQLEKSEHKIVRLCSMLTLGKWQISNRLMTTVAAITVLSGLSIALYTGMEISVVASRPMWHQPASPIIWFVTAFFGAIGFSLFILSFLSSNQAAQTLTSTDVSLLKRSVVICSVLSLILLPIWVSNGAYMDLLHYGQWFANLLLMMGAFAACLVMSLWLLRGSQFKRISLWAASALTISTCWSIRWMTMIEVQTLPKFDVGPYPYDVPWGSPGILGVVGMAGLWLLLAMILTELVSAKGNQPQLIKADLVKTASSSSQPVRGHHG